MRTIEDEAALITLVATDRNGDALSYQITSLPTHGKLYKGNSTAAADEITSTSLPFTLPNSGNQVKYVPNTNYNNTQDSRDTVTFQAKDSKWTSNIATVFIRVDPVNDAPSFTKGANQTVDEDAGAQTVNGWATAISAGPANESGQNVSFEVTNNTNTTLFSTQPSVAANGALTYTPAANANGTATVSVKIKDDGGTANGGVNESAVQTFTITVTAVDDNPVAVNDTKTVAEDAAATTIDVLANDTDIDDGPKTIASVTQPTNGTVVITNSGNDLTYQPKANYCNGGSPTDDFKYKLNGGSEATVSVTVSCVNDAPVAVDDSANVDEGGTFSNVNVLANDTDAENDTLEVVLVSGPAHADGSFSLHADGSFSYTHDGSETTSDSFTYKANDGSADSNVATVNITVNPVNDEPSFTAGGDVTVNEDSGAYSAAWATAISAGPNEGGQNVSFVVTNNNDALFSVQPAISPSGTLTFTPAPNAFGTATVTVFAQDDGGTANGGDDDTSPSQTFTITVTAVNDAPEANGDGPYTVNEDTTLTVTAPGVLANDTDVDADALSVSRFSFQCDSPNSTGFVRRNADGSFSYTPRPNYNGPDSFGYRVNDGTVDSNCATVEITVKSVNDLPVVDLSGPEPPQIPQTIDTTVLFTAHFTAPGSPPNPCCPVVLAPNTTVSDPDDTMLESAEIKLANRPDGNNAESLSMDLEALRETKIDSLGYDRETGILALFGPDTLANFQKVLRTVEYDNSDTSPNPSDRLVTFKVNDGEADSQVATATVQVRCDNPDPTICPEP